jgi:hypothetical protein
VASGNAVASGSGVASGNAVASGSGGTGGSSLTRVEEDEDDDDNDDDDEDEDNYDKDPDYEPSESADYTSRLHCFLVFMAFILRRRLSLLSCTLCMSLSIITVFCIRLRNIERWLKAIYTLYPVSVGHPTF